MKITYQKCVSGIVAVLMLVALCFMAHTVIAEVETKPVPGDDEKDVYGMRVLIDSSGEPQIVTTTGGSSFANPDAVKLMGVTGAGTPISAMSPRSTAVGTGS